MIKSFLRGFFASFLLLSMTASASAQTKTWRHSLYQGIGLSNKLNDEDKQTVALRIGYAVSYTIAPRWAVTQGVALRLKGFGKDCYFAGNCSSTYIDLPLLLQYHFNKEWKTASSPNVAQSSPFWPKGESMVGEPKTTWSMARKNTETLTWAFSQPCTTKPRAGGLAFRLTSACWIPSVNTGYHTTGFITLANTMTKDTMIRD